MAERRMFSKRIINSARFLKMPVSTQCLYFHLGLHADDDGIVEAYTVMNSVGATEDDLKILVAKNFIVVLNEDLVSYITDWKENNKIRADRKVDSIYKDLLVQMLPDVELQQKRQRADVAKKMLNGQPMDNQWTSNGQPMDGIDKDSIGKDSIGKDNSSAKAPEKYIVDLPTNRFNTIQECYFVTEDFYRTMVEIYPNVNVLEELNKMKGWLITNTTKRKTLKGMEKFINGWLSRQQDKFIENKQGGNNNGTTKYGDGSLYANLER